MHRVNLNLAPAAIQQFVSTLPVDPEGVELELNGHVICKVIGPNQLSESERDAVLQEGLKLMKRAQDRNKGVPSKVIEREVREAVDQVRRSGR